MENERCENCAYYSVLRHDFKVGTGFEHSHCCVMIPMTELKGYVIEVGPNDRCEAFARRATPEPIRANARREPNLDGKCGSCAHSVTAEGHFGNSQSYVECKNPELQARRSRQDHPLTAVRSRTTKGCKQYKRRMDNDDYSRA